MSRKLTTAEMGRMNVDQYREAVKLPLVVVLDNVRSQHNVGAVFRTADAMHIERVVLCGICCCPPNAEIHKTALGAKRVSSGRITKRLWTQYVPCRHKAIPSMPSNRRMTRSRWKKWRNNW